ncbi:hypothetical protein QBC37DRAFT_110129 [Rhypophila decipiens]|uniref:Uncharacterized protein n=1 Tax=Rhypophila decipiens TaxID=261697 RepID=A0AAN6YJ34_9PEZI|nr:hypothetical protein QBC37DRAFT_110129 [Rhypophila decipiens]
MDLPTYLWKRAISTMSRLAVAKFRLAPWLKDKRTWRGGVSGPKPTGRLKKDGQPVLPTGHLNPFVTLRNFGVEEVIKPASDLFYLQNRDNKLPLPRSLKRKEADLSLFANQNKSARNYIKKMTDDLSNSCMELKWKQVQEDYRERQRERTGNLPEQDALPLKYQGPWKPKLPKRGFLSCYRGLSREQGTVLVQLRSGTLPLADRLFTLI